MAFIYTSENGAKLTPSQEELLETIENIPSPYEGITSLKELRTLSGLSVVVSDRKSLIGMLEEYIETYRREMAYFFSSGMVYHRNQGVIGERINWAEEQLKKAKEPGEGTSPLLGLYSRKLQWYTNDAPIVYLFADNINDYASKVGQSPDFVFGYVLIHEMMHAYYDAFNSKGNPAVYSLEEPFAEFGMLTFLNQNKFILSGILRDAIDHVLAKINNGPREYGFGLEMFRRAGGYAVDMVERYRDISNRLDCIDILNFDGANKYFECVRNYSIEATEINAERCYESVLDILDYDWREPINSIQPAINPLSR